MTQFVIMIPQKIMKGRLSIGGTGISTVGRLGMRCGYMKNGVQVLCIL